MSLPVVSLPAAVLILIFMISCCTTITDIADAFHVHAPTTTVSTTRHNELLTTTSTSRRAFEPLHVAASPSFDVDGSKDSNSNRDLDSSVSSSNANIQTKLSPLSMTIDELSSVLGGRGRALMVWDCLRQGIDPILLFETILQQKHEHEQQQHQQQTTNKGEEQDGEDSDSTLNQNSENHNNDNSRKAILAGEHRSARPERPLPFLPAVCICVGVF
jgi:hypothetical protein